MGVDLDIQCVSCPQKDKVRVRKKDMRASLKQKCGLGTPLLGLGRASEDGANCGEYRALAASGFVYQMPAIVCVFVCVCSVPCIPSLVCLLTLPVPPGTLVEVGLPSGCQANLI